MAAVYIFVEIIILIIWIGFPIYVNILIKKNNKILNSKYTVKITIEDDVIRELNFDDILINKELVINDIKGGNHRIYTTKSSYFSEIIEIKKNTHLFISQQKDYPFELVIKSNKLKL